MKNSRLDITSVMLIEQRRYQVGDWRWEAHGGRKGEIGAGDIKFGVVRVLVYETKRLHDITK